MGFFSKYKEAGSKRIKQDSFIIRPPAYFFPAGVTEKINCGIPENKSHLIKKEKLFTGNYLKKHVIDVIKALGGFFEHYLRAGQIKKYKEVASLAFCKDAGTGSYRIIIGLKFIFTVFFVFAAFMLANSFYLALIAPAVAGICGFFIPDLIFKKMAAAKSEEFNMDLPYIIDLIYISTMSGQNIYNSLKILVQNYKSRATSEIEVFLNEINTGIGRQQAFNNIVARNNIENFRNLIFLILQAEKYGSSINEIFRQKSKYLRFEISQKIELGARKTSIFLLFPLAFLILPAFVLLVGGPLIFTLSGSFLFY